MVHQILEVFLLAAFQLRLALFSGDAAQVLQGKLLILKPPGSAIVQTPQKYRKMKHSAKIIALLSSILLFLAGCHNITKHKQDGWTITANEKTHTLTFEKDTLGVVADQVRLTLVKGQKVTPLTKWTIEQKNDSLKIYTETPRQIQWKFVVSGSAINVECAHPEAVLIGMSPAGEKRIPARIANQDNGIMYTQMGYVSATNIYNLFDMPTDMMIRFTEESRLSRNKNDNRWMDIEVPVGEDREIGIVKNYYTDVIGLSDYQKTDFKPVYKPLPDRFNTAPTGWSSWYCYYMSPDQEDLMKETDALAKKLHPYGLDYVQLDAAFTRGREANWLEWNKQMYPDGGKHWFDHIRKKGLKPGLWVNAYGANYANPAMADSYPEEYFLRDTSGNLSGACCTADTTVVRMDYTHPEVIEKHLKPLIETLVNDWGLTYLKDAGWGTWMDYYEENRANAYHPDMDSREAYRNAQAVIREAMGEDNYIVGCAMHEVGIGFGFFDGSRTGGDDYAQWTGEGHWSGGMQTYFNSLFGANYLNGICWWSDPDDVMIRDPLNMDEARTIVSSISLSGQAYIISDFIAGFSKERLHDFLHSEYAIGWAGQYPDKVKALEDEKLQLYRETMPSMPIRAMDLYPFKCEPTCSPKPKKYPRAMDLKISSASGVYDVVALYNWKDEKSEKVLDLQEDLGLKNNTQYLVFDFWGKKLVGTSTLMIKQEIPAHGTKALIVKEVSEQPQLLATSRHLTAAYSLLEMEWDNQENTLTGTSQTVPGDPYSLYIHIPEDYEFETAEVQADDYSHRIKPGGMLQVSFTGKEEPVEWQLIFN